MPFDEDWKRAEDKMPAERLSRPMLLGVSCFAVVLIIGAALGVASSARGDFIVGSNASSPSAAISLTQSESSQGEAGTSSANREGSSTSTKCFVYVVGSVKNPGVYELPADARVEDAVQAAGGFNKKADRTAVNLARVIVDGEQITIPAEGETVAPAEGNDAFSPGASQSTGGKTSAGGKVNINTATASELEQLPGIGAVTAEKIIASRESEGPYASVEDLKRVSGIGDKKYQAISDSITV